jgi:hypothetical protein
VVLGTLAAAGMLGLGQGAASANMVWCVSDPPAQVVTPGGHTLTVNNMIYLTPGSRVFEAAVVDGVTAAPDGTGGTLLTVQVFVPYGVSSGRVVSSVNRYQVSSQGVGSGGSVVTLYLDVPAS